MFEKSEKTFFWKKNLFLIWNIISLCFVFSENNWQPLQLLPIIIVFRQRLLPFQRQHKRSMKNLMLMLSTWTTLLIVKRKAQAARRGLLAFFSLKFRCSIANMCLFLVVKIHWTVNRDIRRQHKLKSPFLNRQMSQNSSRLNVLSVW